MSTILDEVAEALSRDAAHNLQRHCAGQDVYVPEHPTEALVNALGPEDARALSSTFGRCRLSIPRGGPMRDERLLADAREGRTTNQLASEYGLTERHVRRILTGARSTRSPRSAR